MSIKGTLKSERVSLRLDKATRQRIERAASIEGKTVSGFIVSSAQMAAEKITREHETIVLSQRDAERFLDAIMNPPPVNDRLRRALEEHGRRVVSR